MNTEHIEAFNKVKAAVDGSRNYWKARAEAAEKQLKRIAELHTEKHLCAASTIAAHTLFVLKEAK